MTTADRDTDTALVTALSDALPRTLAWAAVIAAHDALLASDWLAAHDRAVAQQALAPVLAHIEHWESIGGETRSRKLMAASLRAAIADTLEKADEDG